MPFESEAYKSHLRKMCPTVVKGAAGGRRPETLYSVGVSKGTGPRQFIVHMCLFSLYLFSRLDASSGASSPYSTLKAETSRERQDGGSSSEWRSTCNKF